MGRHAAPGMGGFFRELGIFALKVALWGVVVFGGVLLLPKAVGFFTTTTTEPATASTSPTVASATGTATTTTVSTLTTVSPTTTTTEAPTTTTTAPVHDPSEVHVQVLNSTKRNGLAAGLASTLAEGGYLMADSANYGQALDDSHVWYAPGFEREAEILAAGYVPGAIVETAQSAMDVDILVVLGASYQG